MKSIFAVGLLLCNIDITEAHKLHNRMQQVDDSAISDIDSLMDKYDDPEKTVFKPAPSKMDKLKTGGPSAAQVSEVEFQILSGTYTSSNSVKADEDDQF